MTTQYTKCYSRGTYTWDLITDKLKFEIRCGNTLAYFILGYDEGKQLIRKIDCFHLFPDYESTVHLGMQKVERSFLWYGWDDAPSPVPDVFTWLANLLNYDLIGYHVEIIFFGMLDRDIKLQALLEKEWLRDTKACPDCFEWNGKWDGKHNPQCVHYPVPKPQCAHYPVSTLWAGNPPQLPPHLKKVIKKAKRVPTKAKCWTRSVFSV